MSNIQIVYWSGLGRDHFRIGISYCRVRTETGTFELVNMSSWDFLFAWLKFMQNVHCLTKLATDPVSLGTAVLQSTGMTQSFMAGF